jgi:transcriptional regulator with XRE-family HTH domain
MRSVSASDQVGADKAGTLLRQWRTLRGVSQFDLALDAGVSQKHVSFVESGRSRPSPQMVIDLAEALDVPLRERNSILLAAGYAPRYAEAGLEAPALARLTDALRRMLHAHEPFPALVLDRAWNVVLANDAAPRFFGCFVDLSAWPVPRNLLRLVFDPEGLRPFLADWPATCRMLLARVHREAVSHAVDPSTRQLLDELGRYPGVDGRRRAPEPDAASPLVPLSFRKDGVTLSYFSLVTTVGTPQAVAAEELRLECMVPADDETERRHVDFVARHARDPT